MAEAELQFDGKPFVPSKIAAETTGYTQDYIGQLARSASILAHRVGGLWYINLEDLLQHKENSEAYVPPPPKGIVSSGGSVVSFDGKEYISSKRAAQMTGYAQDYVGQLARSGKIGSRQVAGRWYVEKDELRSHKQEKDALLAAVQAQAVGVQSVPAVEVYNKPLKDLEQPLYTYVTEENVSSGLPRLSQKPIKPLISESRISISSPISDDKNIEKSETEVTHHIAIRAMHRDLENVATATAEGTVMHDLSRQNKSRGSVFKRRSKFGALLIGAILTIGVAFGGFYAGLVSAHDAGSPSTFTAKLDSAIVSVLDKSSDLLGLSLQYKRK